MSYARLCVTHSLAEMLFLLGLIKWETFDKVPFPISWQKN